MTARPGICTVMAFALTIGMGNAAAQGKSGDDVYKEVCSQCHATGDKGSPKFGDRKAWAGRIKEGQVGLTADGYLGVRQMPPKGGRDDLSLEEFARAVVHMAKAAGATWKDPDDKMISSMKARIAKREAAKAKKK